MFRILHPNRYFVWTVITLFIFGFLTWAAVERYAIDVDTETAYYATSLQRGAVADWKIYHNQKYGFEFKYPLLGIHPIVQEDGQYISIVYQATASSVPVDSLHFSIKENSQKLPLENIFNGTSSEDINLEGWIKSGNIKVLNMLGGGKIYRMTAAPTPIGYQGFVGMDAVIVPPSQSYYVISSVNGQIQELGLYGYNPEVFIDQVLSTFMFTK